MEQKSPFGNWWEAISISVLIVVLMWMVYWAQFLFFDIRFHHWGLLPRSLDGLKGIIFMPFIHSKSDINHILNNSFPSLILFSALFYYYREIVWKVVLFLWIGTGMALWLYAENKGAYHIGMSGIIYALIGFLFTSGVIRKYLPLQALSLFVVFLYGSLIWGIFPLEVRVSWEGHLMGLVIGILAAFIFRKKGIQPPKYQYEIEKEMGIEPPDLEGIWRENVRKEEERLKEEEQRKNSPIIVYHFKPENQESKHQDDKKKPSSHSPDSPPTSSQDQN